MYDWWPGYKAGTLIYNQTMGNGSWTGWEIVDAVSVGTLGAAKGLIVAADATRKAASAELFAARTAPELQGIFGWGRGLEGAQTARSALDVNKMEQIRSSITRAEVETVRDLYNSAASTGRGGAVAAERARYMTEIIKKW